MIGLSRVTRYVSTITKFLKADADSEKSEVHYITPGKTSLIPPRWKPDAMPNFLLPKEEFNCMNYAKRSDRTWQPQLQWVDTTPPLQARTEREQRSIDWIEKEKPLIELAFDKPEAIPLFLKDLFIRGYIDAMDAVWFEKAIYWTRETRYWRAIGIYYPFYHENRLRIHLWRFDVLPGQNGTYDRGPIVGAPYISLPMIDAIYDLEKAHRRSEAGLAPNYRWENWTPNGFKDGQLNDWLPRLPSMRWDPDPDGVILGYEELDFILKAPENKENPNSLHEMLKKRYKAFIFADGEQYDCCFNDASSDGMLTPHDFLNIFKTIATPFSSLRDAAYAAAYMKHYKREVQTTKEVEAFSHEILPRLRKENDCKVEAFRLFYNSSSDIHWIRRYIEEKTGIADVLTTPDKELTLIIGKLLTEMRNIITHHSWGPALAQSTTLGEYQKVLGPIAYDVALRLQNAVTDRRREQWNQRFSGEGQEEQTLDLILQKMTQRTQSRLDVNNLGDQFDREREPVGRETQRRILPADKQGGKGRFYERMRSEWADSKPSNDSSHS